MNKQHIDRRRLPIGVFDSGVGGLSVLRVLKERFPKEDFIYVGDSANNPIGNRSQAEISELAIRIGQFLERVPVKLAVVACNTFTVASLDVLQETFTFPFVGMSKGIRTAVEASPQQRIAVMATQATIDSHHHAEEMQRQGFAVSLIEQACPLLAQVIEQGHIVDDEVQTLAAEYIAPLYQQGVDTVILGCTHYPLIQPVLAKYAGSAVTFIDPSEETADAVAVALVARGLQRDTQDSNDEGELTLCFTGELAVVEPIVSQVLPTVARTIRKVTL